MMLPFKPVEGAALLIVAAFLCFGAAGFARKADAPRMAVVVPAKAPTVESQHGRTYAVRIVRVVDGDTVEADIYLGFRHWLLKEKIRLSDRLAPEMNTPDGPVWQRELEVLFPPGSTARLITKGASEREKYGRVLGRLETAVTATVTSTP